MTAIVAVLTALGDRRPGPESARFVSIWTRVQISGIRVDLDPGPNQHVFC